MFEYKIVKVFEKDNLESIVNDFAKDGYKLHSIAPVVIPGDRLHYEHVSFVVSLEKEITVGN